MATGKGIRAGAAYVELYGDATKLNASLKTVEKKFKAFGAAIAGWGQKLAIAGAGILAPLIAVAKSAGTLGDEFYNMSRRTGASVEALSELDYAASQSGASIEDVETGIKKLQKSLGEINGDAASGEAADALRDLGISATELKKQKPEDQIETIATALSAVKDPAKRTAEAMALFGRNGATLIPLLSEGAAGIEKLRGEAKRLGLTISTEDAMAANAFSDELEKLWKVVRKLGFDIGAVLFPPLTKAAEKIIEIVHVAGQWIRENKEFVVWTLAVGAALLAAGAALFIFGEAIVYGVTVLTAIQAAIAGVWAALAAIGGAIATIVTSPILAAIAVIVALAAAFLWLSGAAGKAIEWIGDQLSQLKDWAREVFQGIADALLAGDIVLAAKILWASLQVIWQTGVNWVETAWEGLKATVVKGAYGIYDGIRAAWELLTSYLSKAFINIEAAADKAITGIVYGWKTAINGLSAYIATNLFGADEDYVNKQVGDDQAAMDKKYEQMIAQTEATRKKNIAAEDAISNASLSNIGKEYDDAAEKADAIRKAKLDGNKAEVEKLQGELKDLLAKAAQERKDSDNKGPGIGKPPELDPESFQRGIKSIQFGTFSGAAAAAAGVGNGALVKHVKATADNTAKTVTAIGSLKDEIRNIGSPTFS